MPAFLQPHLKVLAHELPWRDQLALWLTNPVLLADPRTARRIEATKELMGGYTDKRCFQALLKLKEERQRLRHFTPAPADALRECDLAGLLWHELLSPDERQKLTAQPWHPLEYQWEYDRIKKVLKAREEEMWRDQHQDHHDTDEDLAA